MVPQPPTAAVTPRGVREGDPPTLAALAERRGGAVLAYGEQVCAPGEALAAAADALARFRRSVAEADDPLTLDPEQALLRATRYAAAARAPHPAQAPRRLGRRGGPWGLVPELLAARASGDLTEGDSSRLARHLEGCAACREAEERFNGGEFAYLAAPDVAPEQPVTAERRRALVTAVPRHTNGNGNGAVNGATAPESFVVATAATDSAAADAVGDATTPAE